jgi:hypothetical protein
MSRVIGYRLEAPHGFIETTMEALLRQARAAGLVTAYDTGRGRVCWFNGRPGPELRALRDRVLEIALTSDPDAHYTSERNPWTGKEVARKLGISQQGVSKLVAAWQRRGVDRQEALQRLARGERATGRGAQPGAPPKAGRPAGRYAGVVQAARQSGISATRLQGRVLCGAAKDIAAAVALGPGDLRCRRSRGETTG